MGIIKYMYYFFFDSVNSTLQMLILGHEYGTSNPGGNLIGDNGATALADALMYVTITPPENFPAFFIHTLFLLMGTLRHPIFLDRKRSFGVFVCDLQQKQDIADVAS